MLGSLSKNQLLVLVIAGVVALGTLGAIAFIGFPGADSPSETTVSDDSEDVDSGEETEQLPDSITEDDGELILDTDRLVAEHKSTLQDTSFTYESVIKMGDDEMSVQGAADGDTLTMSHDAGSYEMHIYSDSDEAYQYDIDHHSDDEWAGDISDNPPERTDVMQYNSLVDFTVNAEFEFDERVEEDGDTLYRFNLVGVADDEEYTEALRVAGEIESIDGHLVIDESDTVRELHIDSETEFDGNTHDRDHTMTFSDIGDTAIEEPDWVVDAREDAYSFDVETMDEYVKLTMENGESIEEGSEMVVATSTGQQYEVELEESVTVGDDVYVTLTHEGAVVEFDELAVEGSVEELNAVAFLNDDDQVIATYQIE